MAGQTPVRYVPFVITTPPFTPKTAPLSTLLNVDLVKLVGVQILIPPGHVGLTGIRLDTSGGTILPFANPPQWITGDDRDIYFMLDVQSDSLMSWLTYNQGVLPHSHYVLLHVRDMPDQASSSPTPSVVGMSG